jgi:intein/homing endonuclease
MNLDYIAGFFDGEGCASLALVRHPTAVYGYKLGPRIRITQKTREILDQIQEFLGMGKVRPDTRCWNLHIERRQDCLRFVELIAPRSKLKSKQLLLLKDGLETTSEGRGGIGVYLPKDRMLHALDLIEQIRNLNGNKRVRNDLASVRKNVLEFDEIAHRIQADALLARTTLNLLKKKSPEHRRKIGEAIRRFRSIPEVKAAYSQRMRGNRNPQFGKPPNEKQLMGLRLGWGWNKRTTNRMQPRLAR